MKSNPKIFAKIIDDHWVYVQQHCNAYQIRTLHALRACRTPLLGGHIYKCNKCESKHKRYNSCRNRHCPQCQNTQNELWVLAQQEKLIETPYFHVVFTIPDTLNELCLSYQRELYDILLKMSWQTLSAFGWNHKYLGAQIGTTMVLHTWGSNLSYHPHVHCIVPGGGVTLYNKWKTVAGKGKFLFPVKAMSEVFREKTIKAILLLMSNKGLDNHKALIASLYKKNWVVYAKPPFGGRDTVLKYLARYTHKIAITHHRIIDYDGHIVTFSYKDYKHANVSKTMKLTATEFIRRFAMHILPKGFRKIRHYGILSGAWKTKIFPVKNTHKPKMNWEELWKSKGININQCSKCQTGTLVHLYEIDPVRGPPISSFQPKS